MPPGGPPDTADVVVVGGGTVGAWCAYFLRSDGLRVTLLEQGTLGQGASSRAAGVVRAQGGTPEAVRLAQWSRAFYLRQHEEIGIDSGFTAQGYLLPCFTESEVPAAQQRLVMQRDLGLNVAWLSPDEVDERNPTLARGRPWAARSAPTTVTSRRRGTSPPTPSRWPSAAWTCGSGPPSPAWPARAARSPA